MPFRLPAPLFSFEWPLDSPKLASPSSTRKRRSNSSPEAPQRSTEAIFNEIIHKIPTIREFTELIYESIPPEQGSLICRTFLESGIFEASNARANFNARTGTLWIRVRLTELHGVQFRWVGYTSGVWVRKGLMNEAESDIFDIGAGTTHNSFTGKYTHSSKDPDLFLCPATDDLPSIVVESGFSESWPRLHADKDLWMYGSTTVNVVILLKWSKCVRNRCKGKPIFPRPVPAPDADTDVVQFTKLDLFGKHMVAGQNPMTVLSLGLSELRDHARHRMSLMGLTPA
ncbi:hypothetical protein BDV30DRAFT_246761 [Aspergillus minisclerotigenes]|uniref:Uncharacterized protein n=1 Tax=Aspergillus minisclerotigenes TaxID=656917 RepID=A0A5N6JDM9_9EURO|nr:hypothetical protein BDV30DRAFT_246761 [Aspergillus minisclerotigenes]